MDSHPSKSVSGGGVVAVYTTGFIGIWISLTILSCRTSRHGLFSYSLVWASAFIMACVTVWSADLGASQTIIIHDYGHIHHHEGFTFGALAIIIVCMIVSFTVMAAAYPKPTLHRTILMGLLAGACIPVQHYISQLYMRNMSYRCTWWSIVLCTLTSIITFTGFFHLVCKSPESIWIRHRWKRLGLSIFMAIFTCFSFFIALIGTRYYPNSPVKHHPIFGYVIWTADDSKPFLAPSLSFFGASCVFLLIIALLGRRSQVQSRAKNNVNSLALARFDFTGRILLTPKGTLPCQVIQDPNHPEDPWRQTIQRDDLEFRWLWRASRFWTEISQHTGHLFTAWETEDAELEAKMKKRINFSLPWKKPHATDPESSETEVRETGDQERQESNDDRARGRTYIPSTSIPDQSDDLPTPLLFSPSTPLTSQGLPDRMIRAAMALSKETGIAPKSLGFLHDRPLQTDIRQTHCPECQRVDPIQFPGQVSRLSTSSAQHAESGLESTKESSQSDPSTWRRLLRRIYQGNASYLSRSISSIAALLPQILQPSSVVRLCPAHRFQRNTPSSDIEFHRQGRVLVLCSTIQEHAEIIALTFLGYEFHDPISIASRLSVEMSARKSEMLSGLDHWYSLALSTQQNGLASPTSYSHPQRVANTLRTMESGGRSRRGSITIEPQSAEKIGVLAWILRAGSQNSLDILAPSREPHSLPSISVPGCTLQELHNLWCGYDGGWGNAPLSLFLPCLETGGDACRQGLRAAVNQLIRKMQPLPLEQARLYAYIVEWTRGYPCVALYLFLKTEDTQPGRWRHPWLQRRGRSAPTVHSRITPKDHTWVPWHLWRVMHHTLLHNREIDEKMWSLAVRREYGPLRLILNKSFNWGEDEVSVFLRMEQFIQDQLQAEVTDESRVEDILVNIQLIEEGVVPGEWWEHPIPDTRMYTTGRPEGESQEDQEEDDHIPMEHSTSGYSSPSPPPLRGDQLSNMPSTAKIVDRIGYGDWWMGLMKESLTLG